MAQQMLAPSRSKDRLADGEERIPMSYDEYLDWCDEERNLGEWVDGEVIVFDMPGLRHQDLVLWLGWLLRTFATRRSLGRVVIAEYEMKLDAVRSSRKPDILFIATEHLDRLTELRLIGPADLAVEIVSPGSGPRDRKHKLAEYASAGIPEYWVIDPLPLRRSVTVHRLDDERVYQAIAHRSDGTLDSAVLPDLRLPAAWLMDEQQPDSVEALQALLAAASIDS